MLKMKAEKVCQCLEQTLKCIAFDGKFQEAQ